MLTTSEKIDDTNSTWKTFMMKGTLVVLVLVVVAFVSQSSGPAETDVSSRSALLQRGDVNGDVFNGHNARPGQFMYVAAIVNASNNYKCVGIILSPKWVLTAGHCCWNNKDKVALQPNDRQVLVGIRPLQNIGTNAVAVMQIRRMIRHDDFNPNTVINDLCKLELEGRIGSGIVFSSARIADATWVSGHAHDVRYLEAAGWGKMSKNQIGAAPSLQVALLAQRDCSDYKFTAKFPRQNPGHICYGPDKGGGHESAVCKGDSGGPLAVPNTNLVVGMTSHGKLGCDKGSISVFMDLTVFHEWIYRDVERERFLCSS